MKEPMTVQEIFAAMIRKGTVLICLGLVFAILLGGWQFLTLWEEAQDPQNSPDKIESRYQSALIEYNEKKAELEKELATAEKKLERQSIYMENSTQMHLDAYNVPRCTILVAVTGLQLDAAATMESYQEQRAWMTDRILNMYIRYWKLANLREEMSARGCAVKEEKYIREVANVEITGGDTLTITAQADNLEEATRQAYAIYDMILSEQPLVEESTCKHQLSLLDSTSKYIVAEGIETRQTTEETQLKSYTKDVETAKEKLEQLVKPQKGIIYTKSLMLKESIKWAVIGGVLGVFLGCAWALCRALLGSRLQNKQHMEAVLKVPFMGSVAPKGNVFHAVAAWLVDEPRWADPEDAYNFISSNIGSAVKKDEKVVILTTLSEKEFAKTSGDLILAAEAACDGALCVSCADRNAQAVAALTGHKKVLLAERTDASNGLRVLSVTELAKRMDATVVGFVTV